MDKKRTRNTIDEVYKDSGLGKWFHDESADDEPGWDRYDSKGNRVGKCGDSKPGEGKPKCLSKQKAARLRAKGGKAAIAAAVRRKRKKDPKQDRPGTGNKPIMVSNKLDRKKKKRKLKENFMRINEISVGDTLVINEKLCFVENVSRVGDSTYRIDYVGENARRDREFVLKNDDLEIYTEDINEAKKETKKKLNKPFRTPGGPKKFSVYVKNEKGNVVKVNFGDPNMEIKRDDPKRRKSFRARHNCASPGPKTKARYWSCYQWRGSSQVADDVEYTGNFISEKTEKEERSVTDDMKSAIKCACNLKEELLLEKNVPTNPSLWSRAKALARKKFDVYPSAYANAWASKWYKKRGGGWKKKGKTNESVVYEETKKVKAPDGFHWMKHGDNEYKLMKHKGEFKPHEDASLEASFDVQKVHESYLQTKRMDKNEKECYDNITKELEKTKAFQTIKPRFKKDIHKQVSKMILIANDLLTKEKK